MATKAKKSFSAKKKVKAPAIKFELEGVELEAHGEVPGAVLLEFIGAAGSDDATDTASAIMSYLHHSMNAENRKKFDKIIHDPEIMVEMELLSEIVSYLIEERTSRPTEASSE